MKFETVREGMVFEKIKNTHKNNATNLSSLYEVVSCEKTEARGYIMESIWIGNLKDKTTESITVRELSNQHQWKYHEGAEIKEVVVKQVSFLNKPPLQITSEEVGVSDIKKCQAADSVDDCPTIINIAYEKYAYCTIDHLEMLVDTFWDMDGTNITRPKPQPNSLSYLVHAQEWDLFSEVSDNPKTVRDIRELGNRIKHKDNLGNDVHHPVSYQQILRRLIQGLMWFGKPVHKQLRTAKFQKFR